MRYIVFLVSLFIWVQSSSASSEEGDENLITVKVAGRFLGDDGQPIKPSLGFWFKDVVPLILRYIDDYQDFCTLAQVSRGFNNWVWEKGIVFCGNETNKRLMGLVKEKPDYLRLDVRFHGQCNSDMKGLQKALEYSPNLRFFHIEGKTLAVELLDALPGLCSKLVGFSISYETVYLGFQLPQCISKLNNLKRLELKNWYVGIQGKGIPLDMDMPNLRFLSLEGSTIEENSLLHSLRRCRGLTTLLLINTSIRIRTSTLEMILSPVVLRSISLYCPNLRRLSIGGDFVCLDQLSELITKCHRLMRLTLWNCENVNNDCFKLVVTKLPELVELNLEKCHGLNFAQISNVVNERVKTLTVGRFPVFGYKGFRALGQIFPQLTSLTFADGNSQIQPDSLAYLASWIWVRSTSLIFSQPPLLAHLRQLSLINHQVNDTILGILLEECPQLVSLDIRNNSQITCDFLLKRPQLHLTSLDLSSCRQVNDNSLEAIARNCPKLVNLDILNCDEFRGHGLITLAENLPDLVKIRVSCPRDFPILGFQAKFPKIRI